MTAPDDSRPISVAELLAKNGTIGSPPLGGRRRRRRGNSDAVTVAELTGEIPVVVEEDVEQTEGVRDVDEGDEGTDTEETTQSPSTVEPTANGSAAVAVAPEETAEREPRPFGGPPPRSAEPTPSRLRGLARSHDPRPVRRPEPQPVPTDDSVSGAERMTFDPVDDSAALLDLGIEDDRAEAAELHSYLRASEGPLFGGQTVADDLARRGVGQEEEEDAEAGAVAVETEPKVAEERPREGKVASLLRGGLVVLQSILAVAFGAGLFIAFDQLWRWNNIVALVLSVLVILGLVVSVRVVRKTEDIASTLIAVAVGALVTLGPLALLQST